MRTCSDEGTNHSEEAKQTFAELVAENPSIALLTLLDELVDLACRGGMPTKDHLHDFKKFKFYKVVVAKLLQRDGELMLCKDVQR